MKKNEIENFLEQLLSVNRKFPKKVINAVEVLANKLKKSPVIKHNDVTINYREYLKEN